VSHTVTIEAPVVAGERYFIDCHCCGEVVPPTTWRGPTSSSVCTRRS
jgi:hypothetical protein